MSSRLITISNSNYQYDSQNFIPIDVQFLRLSDYSTTKLSIRRCNIDFQYDCIGNSNGHLKITHNSIDYNIDLTEEIFKDETSFSIRLKDTINAQIPNNLFDVVHTKYTVPLNTVTRENCYHISTYTINTTDSSNFDLDFTSRNSMGPIMGFNKDKTYTSLNTYTSSFVIPIERYNCIYVHNRANYTVPLFDQVDDANCKMMLYDSSNNLIQNNIDNNDATISLKYNNPSDTSILYQNIVDYLQAIEDNMNEYSNSFTPAAVFKISFDYATYKITITNTTGAKFGIGFDLYNPLNQTNNYGAMNLELGFHKKKYLGINNITSIKKCRIVDYIYPNEYILLESVEEFYYIDSSNITNFNSRSYAVNPDDNLIDGNIIFALPLSNIDKEINSSYNKEYVVDIDQQLIKNNNILNIEFYIRLRSGRHMRIFSWDMLFSLDY